MEYKWIAVLGEFTVEEDTLIFKGGKQTTEDGRPIFNVGNFICDQTFGGGTISAKIKFTATTENEACGLILSYNPQMKGFTIAALGTGGALCGVQTFTGDKWITHSQTGIRSQLKAGQEYDLKVLVAGSRVTVSLNGVNVLVTDLPFPLPIGQAGAWSVGGSDIRISEYTIDRQTPKAFVVMQLTPPYDELYKDVIVPICKDLELLAVRADETYGPGLIIADIAREIIEAKVVIAEITPANPNVYYEVGFAHALNKPTILIAEKPTELPFDVSPFRVLFYENTISGKAKIQTGLRKHLEAIQRQ